MEYKKNAIDLTDLALGIVILGITVAIGARILIQVRDNQQSDTDTFVTSNETILASDGGTALANTWVSSLGTVTNATGGEIINAANYTLAVDGVSGTGTVTWVGSSTYNSTNVNATYTSFNETDPRWSLPNDAAAGLAEYGNWFDIIVIVGIAGLILALIFMAFGNRGGGGSGDSVAY